MNNYIDNRLREWAEWSWMRVDGWYGSGGEQFGYTEPMPSHRSGYIGMPSHPRCLETEAAVGWLRIEQKRSPAARGTYDSVVIHYRNHPEWSAAMQADLLGVSQRTLWRRLEASHGLLVGYFLDRSLHLVLPQIEELRGNIVATS